MNDSGERDMKVAKMLGLEAPPTDEFVSKQKEVMVLMGETVDAYRFALGERTDPMIGMLANLDYAAKFTALIKDIIVLSAMEDAERKRQSELKEIREMAAVGGGGAA